MGLWSRLTGPSSPQRRRKQTARAAPNAQSAGSLLQVSAHDALRNLTGQGFQFEYARQEKSLLSSAERYLFYLIFIQLVVYAIYFVVAFSTVPRQLLQDGRLVLSILLLPVLPAVLFMWPVLLARRYFSLQRTKRMWMDNQEINFREEARKMSDSILAAAQRRVTQNIKIHGSQSQIVVAGGDITGLTQALVINGSKEHVEGLALLIEYAKGSGNKEAVKIAEFIAKESENAPVNRSVLFDCWTKLTSLLPGIAEITKIATAVKALFV